MHEFTITKAILSIVLEKALEVKAARITRVELQIGKLTGYLPESIQLQFAILSKGTMADNACLSFHQTPGKLHCRKCGLNFTTDTMDIACQNCHTMEVDILSGLELSVENMDVD